MGCIFNAQQEMIMANDLEIVNGERVGTFCLSFLSTWYLHMWMLSRKGVPTIHLCWRIVWFSINLISLILNLVLTYSLSCL